MKASLKFREEQQHPLFRAKLPLNILGFQFQSGVSLSPNDSKQLSLNLKTLFQSGPSFNLLYKPNDSSNPFGFLLKTGIGSFGSPISSPLSISAEFNLTSRGNPSFFLRFSPQIGDFSIRKSSGSTQSINSDAEGSEAKGVYRLINGGKATESNAVNVIDGLFKGVELNARTLLPVKNHALLKFRWGVRFPAEIKSVLSENGSWNPTAVIPFLVMRKISIEHVSNSDGSNNDMKRDPGDVADACLAVNRQLEILHAENRLLRKAVEEIRSEIGVVEKLDYVAGSLDSGKAKARNGSERNGEKRTRGKTNGDFIVKVIDKDVNDGLKNNASAGN